MQVGVGQRRRQAAGGGVDHGGTQAPKAGDRPVALLEGGDGGGLAIGVGCVVRDGVGPGLDLGVLNAGDDEYLFSGEATAAGFAVLGFDEALHGLRAPAGTNPNQTLVNTNNLGATRDLTRQIGETRALHKPLVPLTTGGLAVVR